MSTHGTETEALPVAAPKKAKKLKPARKQVKAGDVVKTETPQTGKEYSMLEAVQF
jgi:plastocyanin